jgi:hypothetical protein
MVHIPTKDLKEGKGRVKDFLIKEGYCEEKLTPECVQDAIDDVYDEFESKCSSTDENHECERLFDLLASLEKTRMFLEKYANE